VKKKDPVPENFSLEGRVLIIEGFPDDDSTVTSTAIQELFPGNDQKLLAVRVGRDKAKKIHQNCRSGI